MSGDPRRFDLSVLLDEESQEPVPLNRLPLERPVHRGGSSQEEEPPRKKRRVDQRGCHWFLTWNNPPENGLQVLKDISEQCDSFVFQKEISASGTPHWQGCFSFRNQKLWSSLDRKLSPKGAWARCRNVLAARNYCAKIDSRDGQTYSKGYATGADIVRDPLEGKVLYGFQKEILDLIKTVPDDRTIHWYWSQKGCIGKTSLCKHLCLKQNAIIVGGRCQDAWYAICQRRLKKQPVNVVVFNIPRSKGNEVSYEGIEGIKDGMFCSVKYESQMCLFNPPHVIVFANMSPNLGMLSMDRWDIHPLDNEVDLMDL